MKMFISSRFLVLGSRFADYELWTLDYGLKLKTGGDPRRKN